MWDDGSGSTFGYITTVEQGVLSNSVWIRADYQSSQTDCYTIRKGDSFLFDQLKGVSLSKTRVELEYKRHLLYGGGCSSDIVSGVVG
jgi:hypothetical protein